LYILASVTFQRLKVGKGFILMMQDILEMQEMKEMQDMVTDAISAAISDYIPRAILR